MGPFSIDGIKHRVEQRPNGYNESTTATGPGSGRQSSCDRLSCVSREIHL